MNRMNRMQVGVFAVVALLVFLIGSSLLGGYGSGMMGPGMMGAVEQDFEKGEADGSRNALELICATDLRWLSQEGKKACDV